MASPANRAPPSDRSDGGASHDVEESTVLVIGEGEPLLEALRGALERHRIAVDHVTSATASEAAIAMAPDAVLLVGDAAKDGGVDVLKRFTRSPLAAVLPVLLLADGGELAQRLDAFRFGVTAVVPRTASVDAIAARVAELVSEIPERTGHEMGQVGEATLDQFVHMLAGELRTGILSVRDARGEEGKAVRLVLGQGKSLARVVEEFVKRVRPLVQQANEVEYEFQEHLGGTLQLLRPNDRDTGHGIDSSIESVRVLLADEDAARADAVAEGLRARGATVVITDFRGKRLERARLLDPMVLVIGESDLEGVGFELVQAMQQDRRLRWAYLLLVRWEELWGEEESDPSMERLFGPLAKLAAPDRSLRERGNGGDAFDTRLEVTGPGRLLRALAACPGPLRVTVQNRRGTVQLELMEGLIVGALHTTLGKRREGVEALTVLLGMASGRVRIEPASKPAFANVMTTIDMALNLADAEKAPLPPSSPPEMVVAAGERARHVASAKSVPPEKRASMRAKKSREPTLIGWDAAPATVVEPAAPVHAPTEAKPTPPAPAPPSPKIVLPSPRSLSGVHGAVRSPSGVHTAARTPSGTLPAVPKSSSTPSTAPRASASKKPPASLPPRKPSAPNIVVPKVASTPSPSTELGAALRERRSSHGALQKPTLDKPTSSKPTPDKTATDAAAAKAAPEAPPSQKAAADAAPLENEIPEHTLPDKPDTGVRLKADPAPPPVTGTHSVSNLESVPDLSLPVVPEGGASTGTEVTSQDDLLSEEPSATDIDLPNTLAREAPGFFEATQPDAPAPLFAPPPPPKVAAPPSFAEPSEPPPSRSLARYRRPLVIAALGVVALLFVGWIALRPSAPEGQLPPSAAVTTTSQRATTATPSPPPVTPPAPQPPPSAPSEAPPTRAATTSSVIPSIPSRVARMSPRDRRFRARRLRETGSQRYRRKQYVLAAAAWRSAWIYQPSRAWTALNVSRALYRAGKLDESLAWALEASRLEPSESAHLLHLGDIYRAKRDMPSAIRAWRRALEVHPRNHIARRRLERFDSAAQR